MTPIAILSDEVGLTRTPLIGVVHFNTDVQYVWLKAYRLPDGTPTFRYERASLDGHVAGMGNLHPCWDAAVAEGLEYLDRMGGEVVA